MNHALLRSLLVLVFTALVQAQTAPSQPPAPEVKAQIEQAIKELGSDVWKEREAAYQKLVAVGAPAVPFLKDAAAKASDTEVRTKALAAIQQIESRAQVGASSVTIKVENASPAKVFEMLAKQARCEFNTYPKNLWQQLESRQISVDLENVNFWVAFKEICQKSGVFPQQWGNDRRMTLFQGGNNQMWQGPTVTSGPVMLVANRITRTNSVELSNPGNVQHDFQVSFSAFCEPKVRVIQAAYEVKVQEAVDEKGNSLASEARMHSGMNSIQWMWNLSARLTYPENAGKKIARLKGTVPMTIQLQSETLEVPEILTVKDKEFTIAGRRMVVKECKKTGQQYTLTMTFFRDGLGAAEWNAMSSPSQSLRLLDKNGRQLNSHGWGGGGGGEKMEYQWQFGQQAWGGEEGQIGEPFRLVWEIPTETRELSIPFEFKDLPLP